jgi:cyclopropane-fatty-acyl-phospholipid synthase
MSLTFDLLDRGLVPDPVIRAGIRQLLRRRIREIEATSHASVEDRIDAVAEVMGSGPVAIETDSANEQHYEVPADFFRLVLGTHLKYSCGLWEPGTGTLDEAEAAMLELTTSRAGLEDGMDVLELGCGWGSLSLWMAERFPSSRILAISNSEGQRLTIQAACRERHLENLEVRTVDMNEFRPERSFDRIVSIEMFEHMRDYREILGRIASWLTPSGRLFVHVFCHRETPYFFEDRGPDDWMSRHFFTGGLMPSDGLLERFQEDLAITRRWRVDGRHYEKTCRAWLASLDRRRDECLAVFADVYGSSNARRWLNRWRVFFLACAELFGYRGGREWYVSHTSWSKPTENGG